MRLTERTDYALRVLMVLASSRRRHTVPALAEAFNVSAHHLTKVVQQMQGLGWVVTTSGRRGGVESTAATEALAVGDIVRALEPDLDLVECLRGDGDCPLEGACRLVDALRRARAAFLRELDAVSISDLVAGREVRLLRTVSAALGIQGTAR